MPIVNPPIFFVLSFVAATIRHAFAEGDIRRITSCTFALVDSLTAAVPFKTINVMFLDDSQTGQ